MLALMKRIISPLFDAIYAPLPLRPYLRETRLVLLEQGEWDDAIRCRLEVVALGTRPEFEALSYVWGSSCDVRSIILNSHAIKVGVNLESALRHLRSTTEVRALWADAISVNQQDIQERNEQVALMRDIYFQCKRVLIWLGDDSGAVSRHKHQTSPYEWLTDFNGWSDSSTAHRDDESNMAAFQTNLKAYYRLPFALRHSLRIDDVMGAFCLINLLAQNKHVNKTDIPFLSNHDAFHKFIGALHNLMSCHWWTRQWVIQEIVLPLKATVHYGKFVAPWELFAHAARNYEYHRRNCCDNHYTYLHGNDIRHLEYFSRTVVELDNLRQEWQKILKDQDVTAQISLRQLLWQFRERDTTDPRDKIYTLFPLVNHWGKQMAMYPDYNWTTQMVFRAVVEKIIAIDGSLLILMGTMEKNLSSLPTWVPDWTRKPARFELERLERTQLFNASRSRKPEVRFVEELYMEVGGVFFDEVTEVSDTMKFDDEDETLEIFASWYALVCRERLVTSEYASGGSRIEAYWRTLCMNTARTLGKEEASIGLGRRYRRCSQHYVSKGMKRWMDDQGLPLRIDEPTNILSNHSAPNGISEVKRGVKTSSPHTPHLQTELTNEEILNFVAVDFAITSATMRRKLFFTSKGYMGLGPASMAKGDLVYVFSGGHMPFVVRKAGQRRILRNETRTCYQLLGDCYVHGIMDGEVIEDYELTKQVIYLL